MITNQQKQAKQLTLVPKHTHKNKNKNNRQQKEKKNHTLAKGVFYPPNVSKHCIYQNHNNIINVNNILKNQKQK
jgi:hypothetical protein